ncbi:MAG: metal-sensing transcriptional repressor [Oscillospiraceae bacterium]|jgi:DNA-binding FrmR family transcriptional regulator|nr:metal-sensing transcriptional repressor [Oscillospiraceae bacterium]
MENESIKVCPHCGDRKKERSEDEKKQLLCRLKRIEGQVRGIERMVEDNAYCPDILIQASAASQALNSFSRTLLERHIQTCVTEDLKNGREGTVEELMNILSRLMK